MLANCICMLYANVRVTPSFISLTLSHCLLCWRLLHDAVGFAGTTALKCSAPSSGRLTSPTWWSTSSVPSPSVSSSPSSSFLSALCWAPQAAAQLLTGETFFFSVWVCPFLFYPDVYLGTFRDIVHLSSCCLVLFLSVTTRTPTCLPWAPCWWPATSFVTLPSWCLRSHLLFDTPWERRLKSLHWTQHKLSLFQSADPAG